MTEIPRQPQGIPTGGQFAAAAHREPDITLAPRQKPIKATVTLERWQNDYAVPVEEVSFDASAILAKMSAEERDEIEDGMEIADTIYTQAVRQGIVKDHNGPFTLCVRDGLDEALEENPDYFEQFKATPVNRVPETILDEPLSALEIGARIDDDGFVEGKAVFSMSELVCSDQEEHLDEASSKLTGSPLLMEPDVAPLEVRNGEIICQIRGNASQIVENFDEDELAQFEAGKASRTA